MRDWWHARFPGPLVRAVAGVSESTLRTWRDRGLLTFEDHEFEGHPKYSLYDVARIVALLELKDFGIESKQAVPVVDDIARAIQRVAASPETPARFVVIANTEAFLMSRHVSASRLVDTIIDVRAPSAMVLDVGALWQRIEDRFREHGEEL